MFVIQATVKSSYIRSFDRAAMGEVYQKFLIMQAGGARAAFRLHNEWVKKYKPLNHSWSKMNAQAFEAMLEGRSLSPSQRRDLAVKVSFKGDSLIYDLLPIPF